MIYSNDILHPLDINLSDITQTIYKSRSQGDVFISPGILGGIFCHLKIMNNAQSIFVGD